MSFEGRIISSGVIRDGFGHPDLVPVSSKLSRWEKFGIAVGLITLVAWIFSKIVRGATWLKRTISVPNNVQYKRSIKSEIVKGFKQAAQAFPADKIQVPPDADPRTRLFVRKVTQFAKLIENSSDDSSMDEIDTLTYGLGVLSQEFLDTDIKDQLDPADPEAIFNFLRLSAKARIIPDGREATLAYGQKRADKHTSAAENAHDFATQWETSLKGKGKVHRDNIPAIALWCLGNPKKAVHALESHKDGKEPGKIVYDALQGNPSFIAHEVDGIQFVHSPTPSAPNLSPVFRMYLEQLKVEGKRHLHFQFQSPHETQDFARIEQMDGIARSKRYKDTFQQVVLSFDALKSDEGHEISHQFIDGESDINGFFNAYQNWAMRNIRTIDRNQPITIPEELLSEDQIRVAFETAKAICLKQGMDLKDPKSREEFTHVMQSCLYGVLMTAITNTQKDKENLYISGGCKQDVDRGPVLNLIMKFFSILLKKDTLNKQDVAEMHATASGRAQIGDNRHILEKRAIHGVHFLKFVGKNQAEVATILRTGIHQIKKRRKVGPADGLPTPPLLQLQQFPVVAS